MQIMFSVLHGTRPDTSLNSLPASIPSRDTLISLMTYGWTSNPDDRPSFLSTSHSACEADRRLLNWFNLYYSDSRMTLLLVLRNTLII